VPLGANGDVSVFVSLARFFGELDRRIKVLFGFLGMHMWHRELPSQYNQLYATALGANPVELGTLDSIGSLASAIVSVPSGWIADRYAVKTVILLGLTLTTIVAVIYSLASSWWILIPAILLSGVCMRLVMPYVDVLFINYAQPHQRSMVMSLSRTLWAIPGIFTSMVAAFVVTSFGGVSATGIRPLYVIQLALSVVVLFGIALWLKPPAPRPPEERPPARAGFVDDFRDVFHGERWLKSWIVVMAVRNIGMRLALPFVPLWLVDVKHADPYTLGVMGMAGTLVSLILQIPAGRLADKIGRKRAFYLLRPFTYLGTLVLILAPSPEYLVLVGVLGCIGLAGGGFSRVSFIPFITMNFEMVPEAKRGRWLGLLGFFSIVGFPMSILGGFMWQQGLMVEVLVLPVVLEVLIAIPLLASIPDTLHRTRREGRR
jgi:MFS family permease